MASTSEIKTGLDEIAKIIAANRAVLVKAKLNSQNAVAALTGLETDYADVIATIQAMTAENAWDNATKAEFTKLVTEYQALQTSGNAIAAVSV